MTRFALAFSGLFFSIWILSGAEVAAALGASAPPLTATFETVIKARDAVQRERWSLAREPGRVAYTFGQASGQHLDVWSQTARELTLLRVFPSDHTTVEYTEGQLRALGSLRSWQQLGSLLPQHPAQLGWKHTGTPSFMHWKTQRFEGALDGAHVTVLWLEAQQLPAQLKIKSARAERTIKLQTLIEGRAETASETQPKHYRRIDAADLGDLDHDPFVHRHSALLHSAHSP